MKPEILRPKQIQQAAQQFYANTIITPVELGGGNINRTWLITPNHGEAFILQRINNKVFANPEQSCRNMDRLGQAFDQWQATHNLATRWQIPRLHPAQNGNLWWHDQDANLWRAMDFIPNSTPLTQIQTPEAALDLGNALALFHQLATTIPANQLPATIDHFHDTGHYLAQLHKAVTNSPDLPQEVGQCLDYIQSHQKDARTLSRAKEQGELRNTIIHGDPKLTNFLFDCETKQACSLIDLDTVGPGLRLHDLGDCLRSCAASHNEEERNTQSIHFDIAICRHFLTGYQQTGTELLSPAELSYLPNAIWLLPFELGVRFLTDFLSGNCYFSASYPEHNLYRAQLQFALARSIAKQELELHQLIR